MPCLSLRAKLRVNYFNPVSELSIASFLLYLFTYLRYLSLHLRDSELTLEFRRLMKTHQLHC